MLFYFCLFKFKTFHLFSYNLFYLKMANDSRNVVILNKNINKITLSFLNLFTKYD